MPVMETLRPLTPADPAAVTRLWSGTLAPTWPVLPGAVAALGPGVVAESGSIVIGVAAAAVHPSGRGGGVSLLLVDPGWQRRGVGTRLLDAAVDSLGTVPEVRAGSGGPAVIWPGVPLDLPDAVAFFTARGWTSRHDTVDLTQDLRGYVDPPFVPAGVATAMEPVGDEVLAFQAEHYPEWLATYRASRATAVTARASGGALVGTLLAATGAAVTHPCAPLLGPDPGHLHCVGVAPAAQGRGIGTLLVAHASRALRDAGTRVCLVDWVVRTGFYARLGYRPWRSYRMFRLNR
ncbi:MAG TPA: GNAT family N-acetyltransferase [Pseudonocardiaceae bacterium]